MHIQDYVPQSTVPPIPHLFKRPNSGTDTALTQALARELRPQTGLLPLLLRLPTDAKAAGSSSLLDDRLYTPQPREDEDWSAEEHIEDGNNSGYRTGGRYATIVDEAGHNPSNPPDWAWVDLGNLMC